MDPDRSLSLKDQLKAAEGAVNYKPGQVTHREGSSKWERLFLIRLKGPEISREHGRRALSWL